MTLQGMNLKNINLEKNDLSSQQGLLKEYKKLSIQLKQLQILEKKNASQLEQAKAEEQTLLEEMQKYSQLDVSYAIDQLEFAWLECGLNIMIADFYHLQMLRSEKGDQMTELTEQLVIIRSWYSTFD